MRQGKMLMLMLSVFHINVIKIGIESLTNEFEIASIEVTDILMTIYSKRVYLVKCFN